MVAGKSSTPSGRMCIANSFQLRERIPPERWAPGVLARR
jgi:hypothetical protein